VTNSFDRKTHVRCLSELTGTSVRTCDYIFFVKMAWLKIFRGTKGRQCRGRKSPSGIKGQSETPEADDFRKHDCWDLCIYRVAQKSKPLSSFIIKSYYNPPLWL